MLSGCKKGEAEDPLDESYAHIFFANQKCHQRLLYILKIKNEKVKRIVKSNFPGNLLVPVNVV